MGCDIGHVIFLVFFAVYHYKLVLQQTLESRESNLLEKVFTISGGNTQHFCPIRFSIQRSHLDFFQNANLNTSFCTDLRLKETAILHILEKVYTDKIVGGFHFR